jgi:glycine C-acetyltransferase
MSACIATAPPLITGKKQEPHGPNIRCPFAKGACIQLHREPEASGVGDQEALDGPPLYPRNIPWDFSLVVYKDVNMDSTKHSLVDFSDLPDKNIMQAAEIFNDFTDDIRKRGHYFWRRISTNASGPIRDVIDPNTGKLCRMIYLASNDYLNLTNHPAVVKAGLEAIEQYGAGSGSVPLLGGSTDLHQRLEQVTADFKSCEAAVSYTSGFSSNASTLYSLLNKRDVAILDRLVHTSIIFGCKNTNMEVFSHNNMESLEKKLIKVRGKYRNCMVVVDGVYSMDGDIAPLDQIVDLAHAYGAYVMVDDAHASGVIGKNGKGTAEYFNIEGKVDIVAGTYSKALGVVGGFIATNKNLCEYIRHYSVGYMFSTGMPPQLAGSIIAAMEVVQKEPQLREQLWTNIEYFKAGLKALDLDIGNSQTAIFPVITGSEQKAKELTWFMQERNVYVNPVFYPAVHRTKSRIRMSIMANHTQQQLAEVLTVLEDGKKVFKL